MIVVRKSRRAECAGGDERGTCWALRRINVINRDCSVPSFTVQNVHFVGQQQDRQREARDVAHAYIQNDEIFTAELP